MTPLLTQAHCPECGLSRPGDYYLERGGDRCNVCIGLAGAAAFARPIPERPAPRLPVGTCPACGERGRGYAGQRDPMGIADAEGLCPCRRRAN